MKHIFNIAAIFLIFSSVYSPVFGEKVFAAGIFDIFKLFSVKQKNQTISTPPLGLPSVSDKEINLQGGKISTNYSTALANVWKETGFTEEDLKKLKKNKDGRILSVEELAKYAETVGVSADIKESLKIWQKLDQQTIDKLKKAAINQRYNNTHKSILGWYKYHAEYAGKLTKENILRDEIKKINEEYFKNVENNLPIIQKRMADAFNESQKDERFAFSQFLINSAKAIGGAPMFGGRIISYTDFCTNGFSFSVLGIQGGWMWIYYATYAINPYLYKMIHPNAYILGRSWPIPGWCNKALANYSSGRATVLYFGTSI